MSRRDFELIRSPDPDGDPRPPAPLPSRPRLAVVEPNPVPPAEEELDDRSAVGPALGLAAVLKGAGFIAGLLIAKLTLSPELGAQITSIALAYAVGGAAIGILCAMGLVLVLERRALIRSIVWTLGAALLLTALLIFVPRPVLGSEGGEEPVGMHLRV